ncbi:MAG: ribonuclease Y [Candidatus Peregrinibacteria bacterium]|nr:ribonuclease Y [Candidatus Peregrinibacteria bacterium]MDZ4244496.1 ribonuclease Y [Candidatus Gracilibacteria bacterium]
MDAITILLALIGAVIGAGTGYMVKVIRDSKMKEGAAIESKKKLADAESKAKEILFEAKEEAMKLEESIKKDETKKRSELRELEQKLLQKEQSLDDKIENSDKKKEELEEKLEEAKKIHEEAKAVFDSQAIELEKIASLSKEEAKGLLLKNVELEYKDDIVKHYRKVSSEAREEVEEKARTILAEAIQKFAMDVTAETTATTVNIPSDDMKGRIIGREGRNIQTFEKATGVDVIVDDTPGAVAISCFDLLRRYIAKIALERLVEDGRIHPARIEEIVVAVQKEVDTLIKELGERAVYETGVAGLHPNLVKLLGRLKFRTIRGQNVLKHSISVAHLAGNLASQIGADQTVCKKAGILYNIGRAADHEVSGTYPKIGSDILKKFNVDKNVIHAVESGDSKVEARTVEAMIVQAADLISQSRPGANEDNLEQFIHRMEDLEELTKSFDGVSDVFAIQAGKSIRVIVNPDKIDDLEAIKLSHSIARKIEKDLMYPGEIKIHVLRETRTEDFAR